MNSYKVTVNGKSWMEHPLYNIFFVNDSWYIVVPKVDTNKRCRGCCFYHSVCSRLSTTRSDKWGRCGETTRSDGIGVMFKEIKMENNQITIDIPKGMSIDVKNSDLSKGIIKFKKEYLTLSEVFKSIQASSLELYTDLRNNLYTGHRNYMVALANLLDIAQYYNGSWEPKWKVGAEAKYHIVYNTDIKQYLINENFYLKHSLIYFKSKEDALEVINNPNFREILDVVYKV